MGEQSIAGTRGMTRPTSGRRRPLGTGALRHSRCSCLALLLAVLFSLTSGASDASAGGVSFVTGCSAWRRATRSSAPATA